ncbi:hypothetical protein SAMD00019534_118850 [Acytostelium subglobosum LB1]|uniref:hypothetical protein n=1 Tax=Acytostelium subglobosum LB1 TaxID=1410327 RepID=UPI000644EE69|nr:hypothetical protein SAMD00019534_118850 [Acytostelium subglobosum LB1]GAM28709.1 hypothetical protein SAMD00019534_118850 [Acytostelium subglobosum LB1]|eukprot:XP_012748264.1 hypothetical protein SAMD00019534_118850 [Acytostelium subglobosum LB1]
MKRLNNIFNNDNDDDQVDVKPKKPLITLSPMSTTTTATTTSMSFQLKQPALKKPRAFESSDDNHFDSSSSSRISTGDNDYNQQRNKDQHDDDDVDTLDQFMENVHKQVQTDQHSNARAKRDDIDEEDEEERFFKMRKLQLEKAEKDSIAAAGDFDDENYDPLLLQDSDDEESNIAGGTRPNRKKFIEPLPPLDHSKIVYGEFEKCFYEEDSDIADLSTERVFALRKELDIRIIGNDLVNPVTSFGHMGFDDTMIQAIQKQGYETPTTIQKQSVPIAMSGRDMIAIAKTGSGKTASFIWPSIPHIMDQPYLEKGDGPIALFVAPTRELAHQIYLETQKFARPYKIRTSVIYGGVTKLLQCRELKAGCEILVTTPGRLIDMIKLKATKMNRVTYLVLDEADRMFDMGFGPQIQSIIGQIRPDRQTLLFSATFPQHIEDLARNILIDPIRISIGSAGSANQDITQLVTVLSSSSDKWQWLVQRLPQFIQQGNVIIFVSTKNATDELSANLIKFGFIVDGLHGDKDQQERTKIINKFKEGSIPVLVATDVAARGLDINLIKNVINFDPSRDIESHTHRIGRTGRAGSLGVAHTLITPKDIHFSAELVKHLENANQIVPPELITVAMSNNQFRRERSGGVRGGRARGRGGPRGGRGRGGRGRGGNGIGFRDRNNNHSSSSGGNSVKKTQFVLASSSSGQQHQQPPLCGHPLADDEYDY